MNLINTNVIVGFSNIKTTRANVCNIFQEIKQKLEDLSKMYIDIVKNHGIKEYTFGLDAFHFQSKLIEHEYENMQKLLNTITNRFYCEYYKLYKIIIEYVHNELKLNVNITSKTVFPVYKDLDKNINYDFNLTVEIQSMSIKYINAINDFLLTKNKELNINTNRQSKCGINIEHIVHYQSYTNALIAEQIRMFIRYMDALNKHHTKYINRLYKISKNLIDDVNADIRTNELDYEEQQEQEEENEYEQEQENEYEVISMNEHASPLPTVFQPSKFEPTDFYSVPIKRAIPIIRPALPIVSSPVLSRSMPNSSPVFSRSASVVHKTPQIEKPVEEKPVEEKPVEEKPVEEKPVEEKPVEEKPVTNESVDANEEPVIAFEKSLVTIEEAVIAFEDSLVAIEAPLDVDETITNYDNISNSTNASDIINEENIVMTIV